MARTSQFVRLVTNLILLIFISYFLRLNSIKPKKMNRYLPDLKHLLIWTKVHGLLENGQKQFFQKKCPNFNCYFTSNKRLFGDIRYFDGVIFNLQDVSKGIQHLPKVRAQKQKYIFAANDSADNYVVCDPIYDNFFNWTWTYKSDSSVAYRFISIYNLDGEELGSHFKWKELQLKDDSLKKELATKSKAAAIFLDKCKSRSKREDFIKELRTRLQLYNMTIDIYGECGTMKCKRKTMKPCFWKLKKFYFFYLALEDSLAEDYITNSILYAYTNNAVPIVYGKADYNRFLPPGSYIDGLGLGAKKVADAMYQIISDQSRYIQFFKWKKFYRFHESEILDICELCNAFNNPTWLIHSATYSEFRKWWNPDFEKRCFEERVSKSYFSFG